MSMTIAGHILEVAQRNGGEVLRIELIKRLGYSEASVDRSIALLRQDGKLEFVRFGVYRIPGDPNAAAVAAPAEPTTADPAPGAAPTPRAVRALRGVTAADHIMGFAIANQGEILTEHLRAALAGMVSESAMFAALTKLVKDGALARVRMGAYAIPGAATPQKAPMNETVRPLTRAVEPPAPPAVQAPAAEQIEDDPPIDAPEAIEMAVWHTGELTLRRGDMVLVLTPAEVCELMDFAKIMQPVIARNAAKAERAAEPA